ncbi:MAG: hypothetical protein ACI9UN_005530 [Granulosicoccus sp.]
MRFVVRKVEIERREYGKDLMTNTVRTRGAFDKAATDAGREDGSCVSLNPQVERSGAPMLLH